MLRVVAWANWDDAERMEIALIARFPDLTNTSTGGEGGTGVRWGAERKAAHAARMRERYASPDARARHSVKLKEALNNLGDASEDACGV